MSSSNENRSSGGDPYRTAPPDLLEREAAEQRAGSEATNIVRRGLKEKYSTMAELEKVLNKINEALETKGPFLKYEYTEPFLLLSLQYALSHPKETPDIESQKYE